MTLLDFLELRYWPEHALSIKRASCDQIRFSIIAWDRYLKRQATLGDLDRVALISFLADRAKHVAPATVNKDRRSILCVWRFAAEMELVKWPGKIAKAKVPHRIPHTFTPDQLHRLLDAAAHSERAAFMRSLILSLYDTGCRIGAMLSANIADVSFSDMTIRLRAESSKTLTEQVLAIASDTAQAIAAQVLGRDRSELIWPMSHSRRRLYIYFRALCEKANVPLPAHKVFHSLRRTTATLCAASEGMNAAARMLGHSSTAVTARYVDQSRVTVSRWLPPRP